MSNSDESILNDLIDSNGIRRQMRFSRSQYDIQTIKKSQFQEYNDAGWQLSLESRHSFKIKKLKPFDRLFEDNVWTLFASLGYEYMNSDRNFRLSYSKEQKVPGKQIDVFAVDNETILIIECKSCEKKRNISFQKEINEINGIREGITSNLRKTFEGERKIAWVFCTENIVLNDNDRNRLKEHKILHLNQDDIRYYHQIINQIGTAAKYQIYARIFEKRTIPALKNKVPAIKGKMGGYTYYSFSIEPETLLKISYILHRTNTSDDSLVTYQRMVKRSRINEINQFLSDGGFFPNSIIINIDTKGCKPLQFDLANSSDHSSIAVLGVLHLPKEYKSAYIIDGQHRLLGYGNNKYRFTNTVPVVAFENLPAEVQSKLFVDINHKQKSVQANLLKSLDAELKWDSPIADDAIKALKSKLAQVLNDREESPLYNRIITGEESRTQTKCITLSYIFDYGLNKTNFFGEICKRNLIKTGPLYAGDLAYNTLEKSYGFFKDVFSFIEEMLPEQWEKGDAEGGFISRNIGVASIITIMWDIVDYLRKRKYIDFEKYESTRIYDEVKPYLILIVDFISNLNREDLQNMSKQWGSTGVSKVRREFQKVIYEKEISFQPEGLLQYIKDSSGMFNEETDSISDELQRAINRHIIGTLKSVHGNEDNKWWRLGIPKQIQKDCAIKSIETDPPEPPENFLLLLDYQKIISSSWTLFGDTYTPPDMKHGKKDDKLTWFNRYNTIRNKVKHPERQDVTEEEHIFIVNIKTWLYSRIN
jgi:DNA sulfur modification protein DndB